MRVFGVSRDSHWSHRAWKQTLEKMDWTPVFLGGDQFKAFLEEDTKRVNGIIESLGIKKK